MPYASSDHLAIGASHCAIRLPARHYVGDQDLFLSRLEDSCQRAPSPRGLQRKRSLSRKGTGCRHSGNEFRRNAGSNCRENRFADHALALRTLRFCAETPISNFAANVKSRASSARLNLHRNNLRPLLGFLLRLIPRARRALLGVAIFHAIVLIAFAHGAHALVVERDHTHRFLQLFRELV